MRRGDGETYEAQAKELTPRGIPYSYFGRDFPPEEWVLITAHEADRLKHKASLRIRERREDGKDHR